MPIKPRKEFFSTNKNGYTPVYPEDRKKQGELIPYYPGQSKKSEYTPYYSGEKKSKLVPYKVGSTEGTPLVAHGTDGEPLGEVGEVHSTDPEKEAAAYKDVIARALAAPHVLIGQSDGNRSSEKGDCTIVFNVPSIDSSIAPLVPTFEKETALRYMFEVLLTRREVSEKLDSFLTNELPMVLNRTHAVPKSKGLVSYRSGAAQSRDRYVPWYPKGRMAEAELSQYTTQRISARNACCDKTGLKHPDWYYGFVRDTYVEITAGPSFIYKPRGRIIFGARDGCHAELPINLPGPWSPDNPIRYHLSTFLGVADEDWLGTLEDVIQYLRDHQIGTIDVTWVYNIVRKYGTGRISGMIFIWNPDIWSCCYEEVEVGGKAIDTDVFDNISIETSRRFPPARITHVEIRLNNTVILDRNYSGYPLIYRHPLDLSSDILEQRMSLMTTSEFYIDLFRPAPVNYISPRDLVADAPWAGPCVYAEMDLGQAWSPKYGAVWEVDSEGRFLDGHRSWCSSFFGWTVYKTGLFAGAVPPIPNTNVEDQLLERIGLELWVDWFRLNSRYISGRSIFLSNEARVVWRDHGAIVRPGYLGMTSNFEHGVLFLYWTRPPMQNLDRPFNFSRASLPGGESKFMFNDPLNSNSDHRDWDNVAAYFDPSLRYNRFRVIHGGWSTNGVMISNFTIVRIDIADELDMLMSYPNSNDEVYPYFMIWREGAHADDEDFRQDGFGQTYGEGLFEPS